MEITQTSSDLNAAGALEGAVQVRHTRDNTPETEAVYGAAGTKPPASVRDTADSWTSWAGEAGKVNGRRG